MFSTAGLQRLGPQRHLCFVMLLVFLIAATAAFADEGTIVARTDTTGYPSEIADPFFGIFIEMAEIDSVGFWDTAALLDYESRFGRSSRLPVGAIVSIERRALAEAEVVSRRGVRCDREVVITLARPMKFPMPYSVFGYHPGSLFVSRRIVLREWHVADATFMIKADDDDELREVTAADINIFSIVEGWIVLDVDMWLDRLLGGKLDDSWSVSFVSTRSDGRVLGLVLALNRKDRYLYGEFDLALDMVMSHGRPLATSLATFVRQWVLPIDPDTVWQYEEVE